MCVNVRIELNWHTHHYFGRMDTIHCPHIELNMCLNEKIIESLDQIITLCVIVKRERDSCLNNPYRITKKRKMKRYFTHSVCVKKITSFFNVFNVEKHQEIFSRFLDHCHSDTHVTNKTVKKNICVYVVYSFQNLLIVFN